MRFSRIPLSSLRSSTVFSRQDRMVSARSYRSRYGLEHHTLFAYSEFLRRYGGGNFRRTGMSDADAQRATERALTECTEKLLYVHEADKHPEKYSPVELAALAWVDAVILKPHEA